MSYFATGSDILPRRRRTQLRGLPGGAIEDAARRTGDPPPAPDSGDAWWEKLLGKAPELADTVRDIYKAVKASDPGMSDQEALRLAEQQALLEQQKQSAFAPYVPYALIGGAGLLLLLALRK